MYSTSSSRYSVTVAGEVCGSIGPGMLVLLGVAPDDSEADARWLAQKIAGLEFSRTVRKK